MVKELRLYKLIPAVLWTAFIVYGLASEPSGVPKFKWLILPGIDKIIHAILFLVESGLIFWAFHSVTNRSLLVPILIWCLFLGGGLELIQHFWVPGRSGQMWDLIADMAGGIIGFILIQFYLKKVE